MGGSVADADTASGKAVRALTARQQLFVAAYLTGLSASGAARRAGFSESYAHAAPKSLLKHPTVAAEIRAAQATLRAHAMYDAQSLVEECDRLQQFAIEKNNPMAAVKALELKAKGLGLLTEKIEVKAGVSIGAALAEAKARASARVVNAPPVALPLADPTAPSSHANTHRAVDPFGD